MQQSIVKKQQINELNFFNILRPDHVDRDGKEGLKTCIPAILESQRNQWTQQVQNGDETCNLLLRRYPMTNDVAKSNVEARKERPMYIQRICKKYESPQQSPPNRDQLDAKMC